MVIIELVMQGKSAGDPRLHDALVEVLLGNSPVMVFPRLSNKGLFKVAGSPILFLLLRRD